MTGLFTTPEERDALAGEYVFGTLDAATAARVTAALASDTALREAVAEWEARLAPLSPDPQDGHARAGWDRMEAGPPRISIRSSRSRRTWHRFWRAWALGASALAASLGLALLIPELPETVSQAVLVPDHTQATWIGRVDRNGALHLTRIAALETAPDPVVAPTLDASPTPVPAAPARSALDDHVLQAWALPAGDAATSLGVLPRGAARVTLMRPLVRLTPGLLVAISLEPVGGSPTGRPSGPIVFMGRLTDARGG